jgi:hypothetical protein
MRARRDTNTLDLFADFTPKSVVDRYDPERVRAFKRSSQIARVVAEALKNSGLSRDAVAKRMSEYLGEKITEAMLGQYASPSNDSHNIPAHRFVALAVVIESPVDLRRLFNALLEGTGAIAVPAKYEALIRRELNREASEKYTREADAANAEWRAGR